MTSFCWTLHRTVFNVRISREIYVHANVSVCFSRGKFDVVCFDKRCLLKYQVFTEKDIQMSTASYNFVQISIAFMSMKSFFKKTKTFTGFGVLLLDQSAVRFEKKPSKARKKRCFLFRFWNFDAIFVQHLRSRVLLHTVFRNL